MQIDYGQDAAARKRGENVRVIWDSKDAVNGHCLLVGMSGAGKTYTLRKIIRQMQETSGRGQVPRFHVFDVHGDIEIPDASSVMFSEQTDYGINPLRVNPDPHFGGIRKRVQSFVNTMNKVMRQLGPKQESVLRNLLYDVYWRHGFRQDDPSTWIIDEDEVHLLSDGSDGAHLHRCAHRGKGSSQGAWSALGCIQEVLVRAERVLQGRHYAMGSKDTLEDTSIHQRRFAHGEVRVED